MKKLIASLLSALIALSAFGTAFAAPQNGTVAELTPAIWLDFDGEENSNAEITGDAYLCESYDGTKALHIENSFSKTAQQYLTLSNIDFLNSNYTLSFAYQGEKFGGLQSWARPATGYTAWNGFDGLGVGGNIVSNADTHALGGAGLTVMSLPYKYYGGYQISDGTTNKFDFNGLNKTKVLPNITDSRWHQITISVDRTNGKATFYVDGEYAYPVDISGITGSLDAAEGKLTFGADALGQYGIGNSNYDNIALYDSALSADEVKKIGNHYKLEWLINEAKEKVLSSRIGSYTSAADIKKFSNAITEAHTALNTPDFDLASAYTKLYSAWESFAVGSKAPTQAVILSSDTHFDTRNSLKTTDYVNNLLSAAEALPYDVNSYLNAGDYDENRITHPTAMYFDYIKENFYDIKTNATVVTTQGNHQYTHPGNDFSDNPNGSGVVDVTKFREGASQFLDTSLEPNKDIVDTNGILETTYYYMTDGSIHYIVINQFENSPTTLKGTVTEEQSKWFSETIDYCKRDGKPIFVVGHYPISSASSLMQSKMSEIENLVYLSGHTHYGFGRCGAIQTANGNFNLELPATYWQRSESGFVGGAAYIGLLYDNSLVLRAFCTDENRYMPEYDEVIYFGENDVKDYDIITQNPVGEKKDIQNLASATASYYNYEAAVQNTELTDAKASQIITSGSSVTGTVSGGTVTYKENGTGGFDYSLYDVAYSDISEKLTDGIMHKSALSWNSTNSNWGNKNIVDGIYIGGTYGVSNDTLKAAVNAGLPSEDRIYGVALYSAETISNIDSILLSTGGSDNYTIRHYDLYVSTSKSDLFEDYNKVFTYKQNKGMINTSQDKLYYNFTTKEYTDDPGENADNAWGEVVWANAQHIKFTGDTKPKGKYIALVARDAGTTTYMRADLAEFRVFSSGDSLCTVNFKDHAGKIVHTEFVKQGLSLSEALTPAQLSSIEGKLAKNGELLPGRKLTLNETQTYYWDKSYTSPIIADTTYRATYSQCEHSYTAETVDDKYLKDSATCQAAAVYYKSCECGKAGTETFTSGEPTSHTYANLTASANEADGATCTTNAYNWAVCDTENCGNISTTVKVEMPGTALGHGATKTVGYKAADCKAAGYTGDKVCTVCNATVAKGTAVAKKAHTQKTTVTKATASKNGYIKYTCSKCGVATKSTATIYAASKVTISKTAYTYNGKTQKPKVYVKDSKGKTISSSYYTLTNKGGKKVGKYSVKVTFKGNYSGSKTLYFTINPKANKLSKLTAGKKQLKVTWKKGSSITGYEIQYSTSKKFKSAKKTTIKKYKTTSTTLKKLSAKKTYYVRIRTYKTVSGKKYYSDWSKVLSKKTK